MNPLLARGQGQVEPLLARGSGQVKPLLARGPPQVIPLLARGAREKKLKPKSCSHATHIHMCNQKTPRWLTYAFYLLKPPKPHIYTKTRTNQPNTNIQPQQTLKTNPLKKQTIYSQQTHIHSQTKTYWWVVTHSPSPSQFIFLTQTRLVSQAHPFWQGL